MKSGLAAMTSEMQGKVPRIASGYPRFDLARGCDIAVSRNRGLELDHVERFARRSRYPELHNRFLLDDKQGPSGAQLAACSRISKMKWPPTKNSNPARRSALRLTNDKHNDEVAAPSGHVAGNKGGNKALFDEKIHSGA
ncbi:hypothetical protein CPLU01_03396 [Colletotrichum plurivorum]|uniref:Uncharacterized protein n=1 Tax=Colletotrichum plurivorum TaxID=2175906 RepID=A0A8H6KSN7_9PEZI|nr:hypothetical protein CPLU01_03396 [Colletotrichum plurivorum]